MDVLSSAPIKHCLSRSSAQRFVTKDFLMAQIVLIKHASPQAALLGIVFKEHQ